VVSLGGSRNAKKSGQKDLPAILTEPSCLGVYGPQLLGALPELGALPHNVMLLNGVCACTRRDKGSGSQRQLAEGTVSGQVASHLAARRVESALHLSSKEFIKVVDRGMLLFDHGNFAGVAGPQ